jgi:hypothetical protein
MVGVLAAIPIAHGLNRGLWDLKITFTMVLTILSG